MRRTADELRRFGRDIRISDPGMTVNRMIFVLCAVNRMNGLRMTRQHVKGARGEARGRLETG